MVQRIAILDIGGVLAQYDTPAEVLARPASAMVADFVGADRGLERLRVTLIDPEFLERPESVPEHFEATVPHDATLQDALSAMLLTEAGWVAVLDDDRFVGILTPDAVFRALRSSLDDTRD